MAKKVGRPTKYTKGYCKKLIDFFDAEPYEDRELEHFDKDGNVTWVDYKRTANRLPTIITFARHIGVDTTTIYEWIKVHKEFSLAFTRAKEYQKYFLIENGLNSCYNPLFAKFVAINITDMKDVQAMDITSKGKRIGLFDYVKQNRKNNRHRKDTEDEKKDTSGAGRNISK